MAKENETTSDQVSDDGADESTQVVDRTAKDSTLASGDKGTTAGKQEPATDTEDNAVSAVELQKQLVKLQRDLTKANQEAAKNRVDGKSKEQALEDLKKSLAGALGLTEAESADPKKLATELDDLRSKYRLERLKGAFGKAAADAGVDEEISFALMSINGDLIDLDVDDKSLKAELVLRLKDLKDRNPRVAIAQAAAVVAEDKKADKPAPQAVDRSGAEFKGGNEQPLTRAMIKAMTPEQINANCEKIQVVMSKG